MDKFRRKYSSLAEGGVMPLLLRPVLLFSSRPSLPPLLSPFHPTAPIAATAFSLFPLYTHCRGFSSGDVDGARSPARRRAKRWAAVERDSEFEIDRDKAREALEKLDQQLKALSEKETGPPKRRAPPSSSSSYSDFDPDENRMIGMRAEEPEFSGSFLAYSAVALLVLSIVNNILFNVFIKPSVDDEVPASADFSSNSLGSVTAQEAPPLGLQ
ncbi:hypothetical protein Taro_029051 [Colocasia esculenta]|uniref:Uncharacterized protein n=1 Tax=Colocasia esculenta TaxID=4460 RepID=A0A843VIV6_COLES|nr:hypothetical protein [Colocasia esculenta]